MGIVAEGSRSSTATMETSSSRSARGWGNGHFFMRASLGIKLIWFKKEEIKEQNFRLEVGEKFGWSSNLYFNFSKPRLAIVTKLSHCLFDILGGIIQGNWN